MMNYRNPSRTERKAIRDLCEVIGAVEVLRVVAQKIANDHPNAAAGDNFRTSIDRIAKLLAEDDRIIAIQAGNLPYEER